MERNEIGGHVTCMGKKRGAYMFLVGIPEQRDHLEDPGMDGKIILRWAFRKWDLGARTGSSWLRIATGGGYL